MLNDFLNIDLFDIAGQGIYLWQLLSFAFLLISSYYVGRIVLYRWLPQLCVSHNIEKPDKRAVRRMILSFFIMLFILLIMFILNFNYVILTRNEQIDISLRLVIEAFLIFQISRILDWFISNVFFHQYNKNRDQIIKDSDRDSAVVGGKTSGTRIIQYIVYTIAAILIISNFNLNFDLYDISYKTGDSKGEVITFQLTNVVKSILILLIARLIVWIVTQIFLFNIYKRNKVDAGTQFAINQLINYVIYVVAAIMALENLGLQMTLLWGGAAALLVGVGLGLQQTFNDFASGVVLLFERSVKIGDILEFNGLVGSVKRIGLRASLIETRDNVTIIVPNSKLVNDHVINWTHYDDKVRFEVKIGVAYGSDTTLVKKLLLQAVFENPYIVKYPAPFVRFMDFGDSSLNFSLYFFSRNYIVIEDIKSDIRFKIDTLFRENNIKIPFPQRELWMRKAED